MWYPLELGVTEKFLEEMTLNQRPEGSTEHVGTQVSDGDKSEREKTLKFQYKVCSCTG